MYSVYKFKYMLLIGFYKFEIYQIFTMYTTCMKGASILLFEYCVYCINCKFTLLVSG